MATNQWKGSPQRLTFSYCVSSHYEGKQSPWPRCILAVLNIFALFYICVLKVKCFEGEKFYAMHVKSLLVVIWQMGMLKQQNPWFIEVQTVRWLQNWGQNLRADDIQLLPCCVGVCLWKCVCDAQSIRLSFRVGSCQYWRSCWIYVCAGSCVWGSLSSLQMLQKN